MRVEAVNLQMLELRESVNRSLQLLRELITVSARIARQPVCEPVVAIRVCALLAWQASSASCCGVLCFFGGVGVLGTVGLLRSRAVTFGVYFVRSRCFAAELRSIILGLTQ